jgi:hypothetical protein
MSTLDVRRQQRNSRVIGWIGLLLGGTLCGVAAFVVDTMILWGHSTGCEPGPADPDQVWAGQLSMAGVLIVVVSVWTLLALVLRGHRSAAVVSALVAVTPALGYVAYGLDSGSWVGGFCIPF